jgi:hypothetical protein
MDTLTFLSKAIDAVTMPLAVVVIVIILRKEVRSLVSTLTKLKAGPVEAEFGKEVAKLHASAEGAEDLSPPEILTPQKQLLLQLAQMNPRSAILEAWFGIEEALRQAAHSRGANYASSGCGAYGEYGGYGGYGSSPEYGEYGPAPGPTIRKEDLFSQEELSLYRHLRALRNQVAHAGDLAPTPEAALNYIELTSRLKRTLER